MINQETTTSLCCQRVTLTLLFTLLQSVTSRCRQWLNCAASTTLSSYHLAVSHQQPMGRLGYMPPEPLELSCALPMCGVPTCGVPTCGVPMCGVPMCGVPMCGPCRPFWSCAHCLKLFSRTWMCSWNDKRNKHFKTELQWASSHHLVSCTGLWESPTFLNLKFSFKYPRLFLNFTQCSWKGFQEHQAH